MLDFLGNLLTGSVSTSDGPRKGLPTWLSCLILFVVFGIGGAGLVIYAFLEKLEVSR